MKKRFKEIINTLHYIHVIRDIVCLCYQIWTVCHLKSTSTCISYGGNFQAAVWLRLAECLNSLGEVERAVDAYSRVVEMAPSHIEARMCLSTLQSQLGKHEEALKALSRGK